MPENNLLENLISGSREEQRRAIRSLQPITVVSAGAGTGKTQTLANRFAWLLASDPECKVDQILTLTFTNAAASEMRERIGKTLREWHDAGLPHLRDAIDRLDEAYISTIHSFALRVIRESGMSLDVDPASRVVDTPTEREFWNSLKWHLDTGSLGHVTAGMSDEWRELCVQMTNNPAFEEFLDCFKSDSLVKLGEEACNMYGSMNLSPRDLRNRGSEREREARGKVENILSPRWSEAWDIWHEKVFPVMESELRTPSAAKFAITMTQFMQRWRPAGRTPETEREFFVSLINDALGKLPGQSSLKDAISEITGNLKDWRDARKIDAYLSDTLSPDIYNNEAERRTGYLLNGFAALFWERWNEERARRGVLSFPDFARYAALALDADKSYASRFRHIMIDEFQDTDELQDSIIRALSEAWPNSGNGRAVFIVGDIKQSIYRFRYANPRLFAGYMNTANRVEMSCSYRMSGALMERVNMVFSHIWENGVLDEGTLNVAYEPLLPPKDERWWNERNGGRAAPDPLEILLYDPETLRASPSGEKNVPDKENIAAQRKKLASGVAAKLLSMMKNGAEVWDRNSASFRPLEWKDVAVLVRTRTAYPEIEEAFEEAGAPFIFDSSREYFNRGEVRDLIAFISALDRPGDEQSLAGWMESPFSGMSGAGPELAARARANGTSMRAEFEAAYPVHASRLERLRRIARLRSPSQALSALLEDDSWLAAYPDRARSRVKANVRRGVEMLAEYENFRGRNLASCADYLRRELRSGEAVEEPGRAWKDEDAIRVMTVHSSKGLEFPVVALMFLESSGTGRAKGGGVIVSRSLGAVSGKLPDGSPSVRFAWNKAIEEMEEAGENARMFYVAMTRAQDRLICCGLPHRSRKGDWLSLLMEANEKNGSPVPVEYTDGSCVPQKLETPLPEAEESQITRRAIWTPRTAMLSATAYALLSWCPVAYRIRYRQGRELKWERHGASGGGAELGNLTHWILSKWDFDRKSLVSIVPDEISPEAMQSELADIPPGLRHVWRKRSNRAMCRRILDDFTSRAECGELRRAYSSGILQRETAFSVEIGGINLVGGIDVFWEDERGCHVRDWKITPEAQAPHEMYSAQIEFYAAACRISHPGSEVDAGLIYLRDAENKIEIREIKNWNEITDSIARAAEEAASGATSRRGNCAACPFNSCCPERERVH